MERGLNQGWSYRVVAAFWSGRRWLLGAAMVFTLAAGFLARGVRVDNSMTAWFIQDSSVLESYNRFVDTFGSDDLVVVALGREGGFASSEGAEVLRRASHALEGIPEVDSVFSLINVVELEEELTAGWPDFDGGDSEPPSVWERNVVDNPRIAGLLLSKDSRAALLLVNLGSSARTDPEAPDLGGSIRRALDGIEVRTAVAGPSVVYAALNEMSRTDSSRLLLLALVLMSVMLWVLFHQLRIVVAALGASLTAALWTFGIVGVTEGSINVMTAVAPTVILVVGISASVHIFEHLRSQSAELEPRERVIRGVGFMLRPCLYASLTTMAGFASLISAELPMTRDLGRLLSLGVGLVFALSIFASVLVGARVRPIADADRSLLSRIAVGVSSMGWRRPRATVVFFGVIIVGSVVAASNLRIDAYPLKLLPEDHPVREDSVWIEREVGPYTSLDFVVEAPDSILQRANLVAVDEWLARVLDLDAAVWSLSLVDGLKRFHQLYCGDEIGGYELPPTERSVEVAVALQQQVLGERLRQMLHRPHQLRVRIGVRSQSAAGLRESADAILAAAQFRNGLVVRPAGMWTLWLSQLEALVRTQLRSFSIAFLLVTTIVVFLLRRAPLVLLAVAVNLFPVLTTLGLMGVLGIRLDLSTVAVASVILGLVVDDTLHFLYRLRHVLDAEDGLEISIRRVAATAGRAVISTSLVIGLGFGVLVFAQVTSVRWFGLLIGQATLAALAADLLLAPALLRIESSGRAIS